MYLAWETPGRSPEIAKANENDKLMREGQLVTQHDFFQISCAVSDRDLAWNRSILRLYNTSPTYSGYRKSYPFSV